MLANLIDNLLAVICALTVAVGFPLEAIVGGPAAPRDDAVVRWMLAILVYFVYFFVPEGLWGTSAGKLLLGLRVVRLDGQPAGPWEAWWRTVLRVFEMNPLLLGCLPGALVIAFSAQKQRVGDMIVGTVVVRQKPVAPPIVQPFLDVKGLKGNTAKERVLALVIDNLLATIWAMAAAAWFPLDAVIGSPAHPSEGSAVRWMLTGLAYFIYFFVLEGLWGTTPGKRLFGLRIVRLDGRPAGPWQAWWRTVLRILEVNPLLLGCFPGALVIALSDRKQRLGDLIAGTVVVRQKDLASGHAPVTFVHQVR